MTIKAESWLRCTQKKLGFAAVCDAIAILTAMQIRHAIIQPVGVFNW
jgi:hypothetical protein